MSEIIYVEGFGYYKEVEVKESNGCKGCAAWYESEEYSVADLLCEKLPLTCINTSIVYKKVEIFQ